MQGNHRLQRGRANDRAQIQFGRISSEHINVTSKFGVSEGQRGLPTLRWDNAVSNDMFSTRGAGGSFGNDNVDSLNSNYRVTICPLPKARRAGGGLVR
jgi:hypothetical protein